MAEIYHTLVIDTPSPLPKPEDFLKKKISAGMLLDLELPGQVPEYDIEGSNTYKLYCKVSPTADYERPLSIINCEQSRYDDNLWRGSYNLEDEQRRRTTKLMREDIDRGVLPKIANGFSFVIDRRPDKVLAIVSPMDGGNISYFDYIKTQRIPARIYTSYLSERKVPIADTDHYMRTHDVGHIPSFVEMFNDSAFADLVTTAAGRSLHAIKDCVEFANAFDSYGDYMRNLFDYGHVSDVSGAQINLCRLIRLAYPNPDNDPEVLARNQALFNRLWISQGLRVQEQQARAIRTTQNRFFEEIEFIPECQTL
jgi:hypothetical protein